MTRTRQRQVRKPLLVLAATAAACAAPWSNACAQVLDPMRDDVAAFIGEVAQRNGFDPAVLATTFAQVESKPSILQAIARPAEKRLTWEEYRSKFLTERRIARGAAVYREFQANLDQAQATTGVPADVILGIIGVETLYGENTGRHRVIDALSTLAFDYAPRAKFFRGELEQYLLMAREEKLDPLAPLGSYAGAMGIPQFMPTSFRRWAVDGDQDGQRNLWTDWADVFASVGNYLKMHGWRAGEPAMVPATVDGADLNGLEFGQIDIVDTVGALRARGIKFETTLPSEAPAMLVALSVPFGNEYRIGFTNFNAITRYNRSHLYASAVNDLAEAVAAARASALIPPTAASTTADNAADDRIATP